MARVITFDLSKRGIDRAIKELAEYKKDVLEKTELLRKRIAQRLAEESQSGFNGAVVDDILNGKQRYADVSVTVDDQDGYSVVVADGEDAVWVEFGAGVHHNGETGASPHPKGSELGFTIGGFGKGNGKKDTWGYYEGGELILTHGTPATMPMMKAVNVVCDEISELAKEVFA